MYAIAHSHFSNRPMFYESRKADISWTIDNSLGMFISIVDAKKHWLISMKEIPANKDYDDKFITRLFAPFHRMDMVKIVKVTSEQKGILT